VVLEKEGIKKKAKHIWLKSSTIISGMSKTINDIRSVPFFSVVIPTFNRPELLERAVNSVLNQSFKDFEIIVVDDGSARSAMPVVKAFGDNRIKYIRRDENGSAAAARNTGIRIARGVFIFFLDDDDEYLPGILQKSYDLIKRNNEEIDFLWTGISRVKVTSNGELEYRRNVWPEKFDDIEKGLQMASGIATSFGLCVKKQCFGTIGLFDESLRNSEDTEMAIRLAKSCKFRTVPEVLVKIYQHPGIQLTDKKYHIENLKIYKHIIQQHAAFLFQYPKVIHAHCKAYATICYKLKKRNAGRKIYLKMICRYPLKRIFYADLFCFECFGMHYKEWARERKRRKSRQL